MTQHNKNSLATWLPRLPAIIAAVILLQTLWFKFTGAPESVYIFSALGVEPWGRIGLGIAELATAALLLVPRTAGVGAAISLGMMVGAIMSHFFVLGIEVMDDGGTLFALAVIVAVCSALVLWRERAMITKLLPGMRAALGSGTNG
jgi:hypothetical protein